MNGAVALQCQAADPGIARKPGGGNLVGTATIHRLLQQRKMPRCVVIDGYFRDARRGSTRRRTDVFQDAISHSWVLGVADATAVQDHPKAERPPLAGGRKLFSSSSSFTGSSCVAEPQALRLSLTDVRVDGQAGQPERDAAHDVAGLAADTGKRDQIVELGRHLAVEALDAAPAPCRCRLFVLFW